MKLTFIGAAHEVTGSATLIETNGHTILVDYGMEQGRDMFVNQPLSVAAEKIDCVLLTHAHIDHSGKLPLLYKNGFSGKIYSTLETMNLAKIMLLDSAHIQMTEAEWKNRKAKRANKGSVEPMYTTDDAVGVMELFYPVEYKEIRQILENVTVRFNDIGHLLGSAAIEVMIEENGVRKKIVFSGDVGNTQQPIIKDPSSIDDTDYLVIESTYGDRYHEKDENVNNIDYLASCIKETFDRGGNVVIPSFAVGRTQEILYFLRKIKEEGYLPQYSDFPVFVDSPLANEATDIFLQCGTVCLDDEAKALVEKGINPIFFDGLSVSVSTEESKAINTDPVPKVIISASGMCDAGRIRHHLKHNLYRSDSTILFVGYQAEGTLGRLIYDGAKSVKLFGEEIAVNAQIKLLPNISGHADKKGLINWINAFKTKPEMIFVNHGEPTGCEGFASYLNEEMNLRATAPYSGWTYDLILNSWVNTPEAVEIPKIEKDTSFASTEYNRLVDSANALLNVARTFKNRANRDIKAFREKIEALNNLFK